MIKTKEMVLMLSFILSGTLSYVHSASTTEQKGDGIPIEVIEKAVYGGMDKSNSIIPTLNGHMLTVQFLENLGQVSVGVTTSSGASVECFSITTPNGLQIYIPNAGDYIVTFTLPNGDEYYGEFTVTD